MSRGGETTVCVEAVSAHRGKWLGGGALGGETTVCVKTLSEHRGR